MLIQFPLESLGQSWPTIAILGVKFGIFGKKLRKRNFNEIIKMNILEKFYEGKMIFDEIRGHLLILPFHRAQPEEKFGILFTIPW